MLENVRSFIIKIIIKISISWLGPDTYWNPQQLFGNCSMNIYVYKDGRHPPK